MQFDHTDERDEDLAPNMTPMIDVVFLLIVFFLVAAQLSIGSDEDVELAVASEAQAIRNLSPDTVTIEMKRASAGVAFNLGGEFYSFESLVGRLRTVIEVAKIRNRPAPPVVLRADYRVEWRDVQKLMLACSQLGISQFDFQAAQSEEAWQ